MAVTKRQKQVLDFIAAFIDENGYSPSYEEVARGLNVASLATVHKHISTLEQKQYLNRRFNQSRSIDLGQKYWSERKGIEDRRSKVAEMAPRAQSTSVPLVGRIAAGAPVEAIENRASLEFSDFGGNPNVYALEVSGDSMIEDHICSGDHVLIERTSDVRDGDIVVALVRGSEATLKRLYREGDWARLQPANSAMEPIRVPMRDVEVQGRLLAVMRKYR